MTAEIEKEKAKIINEWLQRAENDLESAKVILRETDNYEITVYHAHQAIEKILKAELLRRGETFRFMHDLNALFSQVFGSAEEAELSEKISFVNSLYPILRYPTGDRITNVQAEKCIEIAELIFNKLKIK